jgi:hypothetical protein
MWNLHEKGRAREKILSCGYGIRHQAFLQNMRQKMRGYPIHSSSFGIRDPMMCSHALRGALSATKMRNAKCGTSCPQQQIAGSVLGAG